MKKNLKNIKNKRKNKTQTQSSVSKVWSLSNPMPKSVMWVPDNAIHRFTYNLETLGFFSSSVTVPVFTGTAYALNLFPNYVDMVAVFDQYRIVGVEWWLIPRTSYNSGSTVNYGMLTTAVDYDDFTTPGSINELLGRTNSVTTSGNQGHYHKLQPKLAMSAYSGAFTSFANMNDSVWIDVGSPGVQYYGVKSGITATDTVYVYDLVMKAVIEFRNKRR